MNRKCTVYVNAQRIESQILAADDEIYIGPCKLVYIGSDLKVYENTAIRIDALHLTKKIGSYQILLLNDISFTISAGKFVALVGGSGAGKSTLLDAFYGSRPAQTGSVFYNGRDYYRNMAALGTQIGYVPQDDTIHRDLKVKRALYYAAKLRLPDNFTEIEIKQRIDDVLEEVEMSFR